MLASKYIHGIVILASLFGTFSELQFSHGQAGRSGRVLAAISFVGHDLHNHHHHHNNNNSSLGDLRGIGGGLGDVVGKRGPHPDPGLQGHDDLAASAQLRGGRGGLDDLGFGLECPLGFICHGVDLLGGGDLLGGRPVPGLVQRGKSCCSLTCLRLEIEVLSSQFSIRFPIWCQLGLLAVGCLVGWPLAFVVLALGCSRRIWPQRDLANPLGNPDLGRQRHQDLYDLASRRLVGLVTGIFRYIWWLFDRDHDLD